MRISYWSSDVCSSDLVHQCHRAYLPCPDDPVQCGVVHARQALFRRRPPSAAMNDVIHQFWQAYLYTSAGAPSGLAVTVWLLVVSVGLGFVIALFLSVGRVSSNRFISEIGRAPGWERGCQYV